MIVVSYGGGTNSTAMLVGMHERGERPDLIIFADTGGEKPNTYAHIQHINKWLEHIRFPSICTVKAPNVTLEQDCLTRKSLPSIAYGFKTCSLRWKKEPQDKYLRNLGAKDSVRFIGIDADEVHRVKNFENTRYPLIEWNWGRDECVEAIARAGLPQPGKSACFFCPSSKKHEILQLARDYPDLMDRALKIEANAQLTAVKGLGRDYAWKDLIDFANRQQDLFGFCDAGKTMDCGCYDGD